MQISRCRDLHARWTRDVQAFPYLQYSAAAIGVSCVKLPRRHKGHGGRGPWMCGRMAWALCSPQVSTHARTHAHGLRYCTSRCKCSGGVVKDGPCSARASAGREGCHGVTRIMTMATAYTHAGAAGSRGTFERPAKEHRDGDAGNSVGGGDCPLQRLHSSMR